MEKISVTCAKCKAPFFTKVRGRGASCPACHHSTYVRQDGTTKIDASQSAQTPAPKKATPKGVVKVGYTKPKSDKGKDDGSGEGSPTANGEPASVQQPATPAEPPAKRQRAVKAATVATPGGTGRQPADAKPGRKGRLRLGAGNPYGELFDW